MSKKQHSKQLARARKKRQQSKYDRRAARNRIVIIVMAVLMVLSLVAVALGELLGSDDPTPQIDDPLADAPEETFDPEDVPCPSADEQDDVPEPTDVQYDEPPPFELDDGVTYVALVSTTCGDLEIELDAQGAPGTASNFLGLASEGFFEGVPFHRTIAGFMIQGGDPTGTGTGGPGYAIDDELDTAEELEPHEFPDDLVEGLSDEERAQFEGFVTYPRGTVAMANSGPDTAGSQFFVVHEDSPLPPAYTVFGEVVDGMDVVDDIAAGPVGGMSGDEALDPVRVLSVTIERR